MDNQSPKNKFITTHNIRFKKTFQFNNEVVDDEAEIFLFNISLLLSRISRLYVYYYLVYLASVHTILRCDVK